jgi:outer membrane protein assembly factor BamB
MTKGFLIAIACCLARFAHAQAAAAMFRGNLAHTGVYEAPGVLTFTKVKWKFHTDGLVISTPAIANGVAYVGSTDHNLYAVDLGSGTAKWKFETGARISSSPAVERGIVYVESYDGHLYAVDARTGRLTWKFAVPGERRFAGSHLHGYLPAAEVMPDQFDVYLSSPAVWHGVVYFGSGDGNVYALDATTGQLKWKYKTGDVVHASPAIADSTVYIGSWDGYFYALDANTGRQRWRYKTGDDPEIHNQVGIQSSAAIANGVAYFGCRDSKLYALDTRTGALKWAVDNKGSWVNTSPAVSDGRVYYGTADTRLLRVLDANSGADIASRQYTWYFFSSPAIAGHMLYIGNWDGRLIAIDRRTLKDAWVYQTDASRLGAATLSQPDGSMNYRAASQERGFYDGLPVALNRFFSVGTFLSSPVVVDSVIYIGSTDGNLYAIM